VCGSAPTAARSSCSNDHGGNPMEIVMYIGGILGTILVIVLILYLLRRI
jgi:nitrate reductase gamma subunit